MAQRLDMAICGGGLAGGLIALAVQRAHPDMRIGLFEAGETFGGNHRWSWFGTDVTPGAAELLGAFRFTRMARGNTVRFPAYERMLDAPYYSLSSRDFDTGLRRALPQSVLQCGRRVTEVMPDGILCEDGALIHAERVIDCRDFAPSEHLTGGWQVFYGRHLVDTGRHGVAHPIIMDADVEQLDGYRFVYTLPLSDEELFVEDTYYRDDPVLDKSELSRRTDAYCATQGWSGNTMGEETGLLPVLTGGDGMAHRRSMGPEGVALAGGRGLFTHPLTSYTVPIALRTALAIAEHARLSGPDLAAAVDRMARDHWRSTAYYRLLARMLFEAAEPAERYVVFQRFYRLPEPLIERFYAAQSTLADRARILIGKPPVSIPRALSAMLGKPAPLVQGPNP